MKRYFETSDLCVHTEVLQPVRACAVITTLSSQAHQGDEQNVRSNLKSHQRHIFQPSAALAAAFPFFSLSHTCQEMAPYVGLSTEIETLNYMHEMPLFKYASDFYGLNEEAIYSPSFASTKPSSVFALPSLASMS